MERAHTGLRAERGHSDLFFQVRLNAAANAQHNLRLSGRFSRMAAPARTKSFLLGGVTRGKEDNAMSRGAARGTGRTAVNPRGTHCKDKPAVNVRIATLNGLPALFVRQHNCFHLLTRYA